MSLRFLRGYWDALRILPISAKGLLAAGYILSAVLYWSSIIATPSQNAQCLNGSCIVTPEQIQTTQLLGITLIGGITAMFLISLTIIKITLDKDPEKRDKLLGTFNGVSTEHFWNQFTQKEPTKRLSNNQGFALIGLWVFNAFIWIVLIPSPDVQIFALIARGLVTLGSVMITVGIFGLRRLVA